MYANYRQMTGSDGLLANRAEFTGNSLRAERTDSLPRCEWLDTAEYSRLVADFIAAKGREMYVVYSYDTPIAWGLVDGPAYCTPQRFSVTTSKGQGYVRAWINARYPQAEAADLTGPGYAAYRAERERLGV